MRIAEAELPLTTAAERNQHRSRVTDAVRSCDQRLAAGDGTCTKFSILNLVSRVRERSTSVPAHAGAQVTGYYRYGHVTHAPYHGMGSKKSGISSLISLFLSEILPGRVRRAREYDNYPCIRCLSIWVLPFCMLNLNLL